MRWHYHLLAVAGASLLAACTDSAGPGTGVRFAAVSAGAYHTCALDTGGNAYCWGRNTYGGLGDGTTDQRTIPVRVRTSVNFQSISAGMEYTCALTASGAAYCWGANFNGQVGDGSTTHRLTPVAVSGGLAFREISAGEAHTCAVTTGGISYCWGAPVGPAPGGGVLPNELAPSALGSPAFAQVSSGYEIACGVTSGAKPYCWGLFPPGVSFADTTQHSSATPQPVSGTVALSTISAGHKHACGLDASGAAYCWGRNGSGQVGDGSTADADQPVPVAGGHIYLTLDAHAPSHSCGVLARGEAYCWGLNASGQLGTGADTGATTPAAVAGGIRFTNLSVGFSHTCGVSQGGTLYCWGSGGLGQLGTGLTGDQRTPTRVDTAGL